MKKNIFPAVRLTLVCLVFFSGIYTLFIWGIAQLAPNHGKGEVVMFKGKKFYNLIAQRFSEDKYFSSRPSATAYHADGSAGSNKGPSNPEYLAEVQSRIDSFLSHNPGVEKSNIPSDLLTASASGLDPDISIQAAKVQVKRIAKSRNISESEILNLIDQQTEKPLFGLFGPEKINVLQLNISLDKLNAQ